MTGFAMLAAEPLEYAAPTATPFEAGPVLLKLAAIVVIPLVLCLATAWFVKRSQRARFGAADGGGKMHREGTLAVQRSCVLHIVRVENELLAVTTDAAGLRSITVLQESFDTLLAKQAA